MDMTNLLTIKTGGTQKESKIASFVPRPCRTMGYTTEYDSLHPEDTIRDFVSNIKAMISKYEYNIQRISEIENETQDLLHYIEMAPNKTVSGGYKLYRKLADLRRERRACKNENDLLQPVYEHFHATEVLNKLGIVQGACRGMKGTIDDRVYTIRTDILDEWLEPEKKEEPKDGMPVLDSDFSTVTDLQKKYQLAWSADDAVTG